ncbi:MAG TPA: SNF2-related protein [Rhizobiaceae bacterium]|nr:SNF2-related protein [Rhizobiaceae bacterium]
MPIDRHQASGVEPDEPNRLGPTWKLLHEHQVKDEGGRVTGYTGLERIGQTLAPIMIRRRKSEVLRQLPKRLDQNLLVPMTEMQMLHHQETADIVARIVQRWRKTRFLSDKDQRRLTCALQNMRMSCNSTYLLDQESDHGVKADELAALLDDLFAEPKAKAVVFSQWTRTGEALSIVLVRQRLDTQCRCSGGHSGAGQLEVSLCGRLEPSVRFPWMEECLGEGAAVGGV